LPHISADRAIVEATDGSIMEIPESAFWLPAGLIQYFKVPLRHEVWSNH
jgi:hypothetical protein